MVGNDVYPGLTFKGWDIISEGLPALLPLQQRPDCCSARWSAATPTPSRRASCRPTTPCSRSPTRSLVHEALKSLEPAHRARPLHDPHGGARRLRAARGHVARALQHRLPHHGRRAGEHGRQHARPRALRGRRRHRLPRRLRVLVRALRAPGLRRQVVGADLRGHDERPGGPLRHEVPRLLREGEVPEGAQRAREVQGAGLPVSSRPTGKVELYSTVIEKLAKATGRNFDPLPSFDVPAELPRGRPRLRRPSTRSA